MTQTTYDSLGMPFPFVDPTLVVHTFTAFRGGSQDRCEHQVSQSGNWSSPSSIRAAESGAFRHELRRTSRVLNHMDLPHTLGTAVMNGNCFYDSFAHRLRDLLGLQIDAPTLRAEVESSLTDEERYLADASRVHDVTDSWADHVHVCATIRRYPNTSLIVVDDTHGTLSIHGSHSPSSHVIVLCLCDGHYVPVITVQADKLIESLGSNTCRRVVPRTPPSTDVSTTPLHVDSRRDLDVRNNPKTRSAMRAFSRAWRILRASRPSRKESVAAPNSEREV